MDQDEHTGGLTHLDEKGRARMVDVGDKGVTTRRAVAQGCVRITTELARQINANTLAKGDLLQIARIAGVQSAKRTSELIPLCHNIPVDHVDVEAHLEDEHITITASIRTDAKTGAEMEALTAVAVAALTVIDMGKAVDREMVIESIRVLEKTGGNSGDYHCGAPNKGGAS